MQLIRRVFPLFKNSIKKNHHFQSFLNSSETRLQHFFAFHVCFYCLYGNNKQKNQTFNLLYIAALSRLWLHFKKSSNSDLGKVLWKVLYIKYVLHYHHIFLMFGIFFFSILSTYTSTTTNYVLCTWSINNTVWARYIMKCIIRSISLWTELISRQYFRIFLFNNLHSLSQDSAYLSTKYLYSKTKKSTWIWASEKYFIYKHNFYYNFYSCTRYLYGLHLLLNKILYSLRLEYITTFSEEVPSFWWKIFPSGFKQPIQFQKYKMLLVHTNFKLLSFLGSLHTVLFSNLKPFKTNILYA